MTKMKPLPSREKLEQQLQYDPDTGILCWKINKQGVAKGRPINKIRKDQRYVSLTFDGQPYKAHRIIWKMMTGNDPVDQIGQNAANRKTPSTNESGTKGVCFDPFMNRWRASICLDGHQHHLGYFRNKDDAEAAVIRERPNIHGEFARAA